MRIIATEIASAYFIKINHSQDCKDFAVLIDTINENLEGKYFVVCKTCGKPMPAERAELLGVDTCAICSPTPKMIKSITRTFGGGNERTQIEYSNGQVELR